MADAPAQRGYAVCATQRSGSNYLCELLASTGELGRPLDYFNPVGRRAKGWADYPDDRAAQLDLIRSHGATANGVYGFKVFAEHLDSLDAVRWTEALPSLRWVYLRRDDLLAQAISLVIAEQTGRWRTTMPAGAAPVYDAHAIRRALTDIALADARWRTFFAERGVQPLELTYETLGTAPEAAVRAVAALAGVTEPVQLDPSRLSVQVQRDDVNRAWRERFVAGADAAAPRGPAARAERSVWTHATAVRRPRLTVHILTRNGETRLPRLFAELGSYADEVVVGVDATSDDATLDVARSFADVVYRFRLPRQGQLAPARMLPFDYAGGDWILSLDDDESMEETFDALVPELMRAANVTHYFFTRKWIVSEDPCEYAHAAPWFPNWSPRLFRNDRSLVWKPPRAHSMYFLEGPGFYESRTSILHFEPLWCSPEQRSAKVAAYRGAESSAQSEEFYAVPADAPRRPAVRRPAAAFEPRPALRRDDAIRELTAPGHPPWGALVTSVDMPDTADPEERFIVQVQVRNTGALAWSPTYAQWPANAWPMLRLSHHLLFADGSPVDWNDRPRILLPRLVRPGEDVTFIDELAAPAAAGDYVIEWDMLSEAHCWFSQCGSPTHRSRLRVRG